jgi:hypothetical protein
MGVCGAVLLAAVMLKVQSSGTVVVRQVDLFPPRARAGAAIVEALVGLWLLSGFWARGAWFAGIGLFGTLATVSGYLGLIGQTSCGCFGRVDVSPWVSLALDAVCVAALLAVRPRRTAALPLPAATLVGRAGAVAAALALIFAFTTPSAARWLARIQGDELVVENTSMDAGGERSVNFHRAAVEIRNVGDRDVRIVGGTANCSCVTTQDLPVVVPAGGSTVLHIKVNHSGQGYYKHSFELLTDSKDQPRIQGDLVGRAEAAP